MRIKEDKRDKEKTKRTETGKYFYDLSKASFSITVLTNIAFMFKEEHISSYMVGGAMFGAILSALFFTIGYRILNK